MRSTLTLPSCISKGVLAIICSNSFSHCKRDQKKTVAIFQMFNYVQLHVHWMHLFNTRICRYTCIYITSTVQTLHYCPAGAWRWNYIVLTSMQRYQCHFDLMCLLGVTKTGVLKAVRPWKWNLPCSVRCTSNKIWTQMTPFLYLLSLIICERVGKNNC